jgi:predicted Zn-dependent peptidase
MPAQEPPRSPGNDGPSNDDLREHTLPRSSCREMLQASVSPDEVIRKFVEAQSYSVQRKNLSTGAKLLTIEVDIPHTFVGVTFNAGSRFEEKGEHGALHFFEHLPPSSYSANPELREKLKSELNVSQIPDRLPRLLAQRSWVPTISINRDVLMIGFICPSFDTAPALTLLQDMLNAPIQAYRDCFEAERSRISREIWEESTQGDRIIHEFLVSITSERPGDKHRVTGTAEEVNGYDFEKVWAVGKKHLTPKNAVFFVAGQSTLVAPVSERLESMPLFEAQLSSATGGPAVYESPAREQVHENSLVTKREVIVSPPESLQRATILFAKFRAESPNLNSKERTIARVLFNHAYALVDDEVGHKEKFFYRLNTAALRFSEKEISYIMHFGCEPERLTEAATAVANLYASISTRLDSNSAADIISQAKAELLRKPIHLENIASTVRDSVAFPNLPHISLKEELDILQSLTLADLTEGAKKLFGTAEEPKGEFTYWVPKEKREEVERSRDKLAHPWG